MEQVLRQSGKPLGAVFGLFLTAAFNAVGVRLSGSRWVKSGVTVLNGGRGRRGRACGSFRAGQIKFFSIVSNTFPKCILSTIHTQKEINVLYIFNTSS